MHLNVVYEHRVTMQGNTFLETQSQSMDLYRSCKSLVYYLVTCCTTLITLVLLNLFMNMLAQLRILAKHFCYFFQLILMSEEYLLHHWKCLRKGNTELSVLLLYTKSVSRYVILKVGPIGKFSTILYSYISFK